MANDNQTSGIIAVKEVALIKYPEGESSCNKIDGEPLAFPHLSGKCTRLFQREDVEGS